MHACEYLGEIMKFFVTGLTLFLTYTTAIAHHARVYFSDDILEIEGELASVIWRNPHPEFTVAVTNSSGEQETWRSARRYQRMVVS